MITTWQKMLAIIIGLVFGLIVGYICIKPHLENNVEPEVIQNTNSYDVIDQYVYNNVVQNTNSTVNN